MMRWIRVLVAQEFVRKLIEVDVLRTGRRCKAAPTQSNKMWFTYGRISSDLESAPGFCIGSMCPYFDVGCSFTWPSCNQMALVATRFGTADTMNTVPPYTYLNAYGP